MRSSTHRTTPHFDFARRESRWLISFATTTVFSFLTLPVELDASRRALTCLKGRYVMDEEYIGAIRRDSLKSASDADSSRVPFAPIASSSTILMKRIEESSEEQR